MPRVIFLIWREIRMWFFVRNIGKERREYNALDGQANKLQYLTEHFGLLASEVLQEIDFRKYLASERK